MRVQLKPGLRRAWRGPDSLQIGIGPGHGTVLAGVTPADAAVLDRFVDGMDLPAAGGSPVLDRQRRIARLLHEADLLVPVRTGRAALSRLGASRQRLTGDAAVWSLVHPDAGDGWTLLADRAGRHVAVLGHGRTAAALAGVLTSAGVGRVTAVDRVPVVAEPGSPDLVVLVRYAVADAGQAEPLVRADVPHLAVLVRGHDAVVGPLVVPGRGPCLRCLDLHRGDRDPAWPRVLAQLLFPTGPAQEPEESSSSVLVAGLAGLQALARLDGRHHPASLGATLEVGLPDGLVARRAWSPHPACGCHWPPRDPVSGERDQPGGSTMSG